MGEEKGLIEKIRKLQESLSLPRRKALVCGEGRLRVCREGRLCVSGQRD